VHASRPVVTIVSTTAVRVGGGGGVAPRNILIYPDDSCEALVPITIPAPSASYLSSFTADYRSPCPLSSITQCSFVAAREP
jgi:hypothetical protein